MSTRTLTLAILALGCTSTEPEADIGSDSRASVPTEQRVAPFSVAARLPNTDVDSVTEALAAYINGVDDTTRGLPADWIVAGAADLGADEQAAEAALDLPDGSTIVEVCNHEYASQAMSFGGHHGVALPCEIAVVQRGAAVEVVLLNPEAIFGVFFGDIPSEAAQGMSGLAATVRAELEGLVREAVLDLDGEYPRTDVGPLWGAGELAQFSSRPYSIDLGVPIPAAYESDPEAFRALYISELLATLTHAGMDAVGSQVEGLSVGDWRSARTGALGLPGNVSVVEMCSPTYAAAALSTGKHHAPALPCQAAIFVEGNRLHVDLLDPMFIFPVFFSDAPAEMMASMGEMASAVQGDLTLIFEEAGRRALD